MDQQRWKKIEPILDKALTFTDLQQREEFVKKACEADHKLYAQVTALLTAIWEAKATNFLAGRDNYGEHV
jgi:hypothetical protein